MINKELYLEVLDYINGGLFLTDNVNVFECDNFKEIGEIAISILLNKFHISNDELKQIICMRLNYDKTKYQETSYDELCTVLCEQIIGLKTIPVAELLFIKNSFEKTQQKYSELILKFDNEIAAIDALIRTDKTKPENNGDLIKKQERICSRNANNKSLLKDLKKNEEDYINLHYDIQEKYVRQEMLKYAKEQIENYFNKTTLEKPVEVTSHNLRIMAIELASEEGELKKYKNRFLDYDSFLDLWDNIIRSIYKSFFMIKTRKFHEDISDFFYQNYYGEYRNKTNELIELCAVKTKAILESDEWISIMFGDKTQYKNLLKKYVYDYDVLNYIKNETNKLYCIQKRKEILKSLLDLFEAKDYLVFINLVVIQIEGLFYDLFFDANIQKRLDGKFDVFEKDDLKSKFAKNNSLENLVEANLYFKFYFNTIIRNTIAHGRFCYQSEELEITAYELLLDLQYVIHLISAKSETNAAIEYIQGTLKWLEISFGEQKNDEYIYKKLLNSLNANVLKSNKDSVSYSDPQQELYWIFNPYYIEAYKFATVIDERNKLINYLTSQEFWNYVNQYLMDYDEEDVFHHIKIKRNFTSRVNAIKMYVAKNKREVLPVLVQVENNLKKLNLKE